MENMYKITQHPHHFTIEKKFGSKWKTLQKNKQNKTFDSREECQTYLDKRIWTQEKFA